MDNFEIMSVIAFIMTASSGLLLILTDDYSNQIDRYKNLYEQSEEIKEKQTQRYTQIFNENIGQQTIIKNQKDTIERLIEHKTYYKDNQRIIIQNKTHINVGYYNIYFVDKCEVNMYAEGCAGWTDGYNKIYIVQGYSKSQIIRICNHEILHNIIKISERDPGNMTAYWIEEELVRSLEDVVMFKECQALEDLL